MSTLFHIERIVVSISDNDRETLTQVWDARLGELVDVTKQQWTPAVPIQNDSIFSLNYEGLEKNLIYWDRQGQEYLINGDDGVERWNANENRLVARFDVCMHSASSTLDYILTCQNQILDMVNNQIILEQGLPIMIAFGFHPEQNLYAVADFSEDSETRTTTVIDLESGSSTSKIELPGTGFGPDSGGWGISEFGWNHEGNLIWIMRELPVSPIAARNFTVVDIEQGQVLATGDYLMSWSQIHPSEPLVAGLLTSEIVDGRIEKPEEDIVQIRDMLTQEVLYEYRLEQFAVLGMRWSPDGSQLAIADRFGRVHIWDYDG
ncbi:MAG: WD40 domain-containing protein [Chloroflexi bacterium]|nr:WD40 domain-containing protein [Chloroflexota bacterium]